MRTSWPEAEELGWRTTAGRAGFAGLVSQRVRGVELAVAAGGSPALAPGLVLDYVLLNSTQTNYVFLGNETYHVTGTVSLYGSSVLEGGATLKFASTNSSQIRVLGTLAAETSEYRVAVFTAKDDNSVGTTIRGSTGNPTGRYATNALYYSSSQPAHLAHVRVRHATHGVVVVGHWGHQLRHYQALDCDRPVWVSGTTLKLQNALLQRSSVEAISLDGTAPAVMGEHLTIHGAARVVNSTGLTLTNSLLVSVTNWTYSFAGAHNATNSSSAVFEPVGAGHHYLAAGSPYRNAGTANLSAGLLAELRQRTTHPPLILTGPITTPTVLNPVVPRDSGAPDLGYSYAPLDYLASNVVVQAILTLSNGVAIGTYFSMLSYQDCVLRGGALSLYPASASATVVALTNNLLEHCSVGIHKEYYSQDTPIAAHLYNNLFRGGSLSLSYYYGWGMQTWNLKDNLFDGATQSFSKDGYGDSMVQRSHNGFITNTATTFGGTGSFTNLVADFQSGPLGRFYYPATGGSSSLTNLVNTGSRNATNAGLYHFTTTVAHGKETNSIVDIGHHYVALEPTEGLVAHWKFDEGTGTTAADASGRGHTGTLLGGASWTAGQVGGALSLDGVDGRVQATESEALRLAGDKTVALWLKKHAEPAGYPHIFGKGGASYYGRGYHLWDDTGAGARLIWEQGYASGAPRSLFSSTSLSTNVWYHVAGLVEGATIRLYLNGVLDAAGTLSAPPVARTDPVWMGHLSGFTHFPGLLDDVRVYDRALSAGEIAGLAARPNWHYDTDGDGIPDYLEDRNGNGSFDAGDPSNWEVTNSTGMESASSLQVFTPLK
jgi:hypothetical protein